MKTKCENLLNKVKLARLRLEAKISEMESYGIDTRKLKSQPKDYPTLAKVKTTS